MRVEEHENDKVRQYHTEINFRHSDLQLTGVMWLT